jgi:hypothetical protein
MGDLVITGSPSPLTPEPELDLLHDVDCVVMLLSTDAASARQRTVEVEARAAI